MSPLSPATSVRTVLSGDVSNALRTLYPRHFNCFYERNSIVINLILGTAGHIDHGKTTLVRALTGIDTDRLPEEKARGITIELGFANLTIPVGIHFGIIDVPGHERFIRAMVSGAGGMDIVMLVIAADEGIMPQTREHLEICQLLGVRKGIVVLTKSDLVDSDWLELVQEEIREYLVGSFLDDALIIPVSAKTGTGLDALKEELGRIARLVDQKRSGGPFRLPVDKVFSVPGFGTVVTGTLLLGQVSVNDEVEILPSGITSRARGVQTHGSDSDKGTAGQRLAINLQGVSHDQVHRGDVVTPRGFYRTTSIVDVRLNHLKSAAKKLKHRSSFRFHSATYDVAAQVVLFDKKTLEPGESDFAQIRLAQPVLLLRGDSFILRSSSPARTVGGGNVLDPFPPARRRRSREAQELLETLAAGDETGIASKMVSGSLLSGISFADISKRTGFSSKRLESAIAPLLASGAVLQVVREPRIYLGREGFTSLCKTLLNELEEYLDLNPLKTGISKEELKTRIPARSDQRYFAPCIAALEKDGLVLSDRELVSLVARTSRATELQSATGNLLEEQLKKKEYEPDSIKELAAEFKLSEKQVLEHLNLLAREKRAIKIKGNLFYAVGPYNSIIQKISGYLNEKREITPNEVRELTGLSRKYFIPFLEHLDDIKLTIRIGDKRVLRQSSGTQLSCSSHPSNN